MLHVQVRGRVQGVGFRWFVRERGRALRLRGWVRNSSDGSVEVVAEGEEGSLSRLRADLGVGPPGAEVVAVEDVSRPPEPPVLETFAILR